MNNNQPNFVFIMTDTQGANVVGCYNRGGLATRLATENIDALAQDGIRFDRAYTTCPVCSPARSAIFTGSYPHTNGVRTNNMPLGDTLKTMGHRFRDNGYRTFYTGKWHLDGHDYFDRGIAPDGWDQDFWFDGKCYLDTLSEAEIGRWRSGLERPEDYRTHTIKAEDTWAGGITERAVDFIGNSDPGDDPFVIVVSYDEPHHPSSCPNEYVDSFADFALPLGPNAADSLEGKPEHHRRWANSADFAEPDGHYRDPIYFGCNSFVDDQVGRIITALKDKGLYEDCCILYTSDHGDMFGAHRISSKGPVMYEEITRIPLIMKFPRCSGLKAREFPAPVSHIDLLPTMMDLASIAVPPFLEGSSLLPIIEDPEAPIRPVIIEFERHTLQHDSYGGFQPIRCIVHDRFKLVLNLLDGDELYDLDRDREELVNLIEAPEYASVRDQLHDLLLERMNSTTDPLRGYYWEDRPWRRPESRTLNIGWNGLYRPRRNDGYAPPVLLYATGKPAAQETGDE